MTSVVLVVAGTNIVSEASSAATLQQRPRDAQTRRFPTYADVRNDDAGTANSR